MSNSHGTSDGMSGSDPKSIFDPRVLYTRHPTVTKTLLIWLGATVGMVVTSQVPSGIPRVVTTFFGAIFWLLTVTMVFVGIVFGIVGLRDRLNA